MEQQTIVQKIDPAVTGNALALRTPLAMFEHAVMSGANIETIERLEAFYERSESRQNRKAFFAALAAAKSELPTIIKDQQVGYDAKTGGRRTAYRHASLGAIVLAIEPILSRHGLWHRFRTTSEPNEPVTVTCIIGHRDGHTEENTLRAALDNSQSAMNALQRLGSTITYLSRYALMAALGLAATEDDDGASISTPIGPEQVAELKTRLADAGVVEANFKKFFGIPMLEDLPNSDWQRALDEIVAFKERRQATAKPKEKADAAGQS